MAKKLFPLLAILFLLTVTPSFAKDSKNRSNSTEAECDNDASWKNHGAFVSCVAHLNQGGTSVSAAAHSDIGKHNDNDNDEDNDDNNDEDNDDDDFISSPTPSPSTTPTVSPTPTPSVSPTPSPSPSPTTVTVNPEVKSILGEIIQSLQALITQLQNLIAG